MAGRSRRMLALLFDSSAEENALAQSLIKRNERLPSSRLKGKEENLHVPFWKFNLASVKLPLLRFTGKYSAFTSSIIKN